MKKKLQTLKYYELFIHYALVILQARDIAATHTRYREKIENIVCIFRSEIFLLQMLRYDSLGLFFYGTESANVVL